MNNPNIGKVVQFTNITDKDFTHAFGGQPFFVKARDTVMLPYDLADHLATHLSRRIYLDGDSSPTEYAEGKDRTGGMGRPLWTEEMEKTMKAKIMGQVFEQTTPAPKSEIEELRAKLDALASQFGTAAPFQPKPQEEITQAAKEAAAVEALPANGQPPVPTQEAPKAPVGAVETKSELGFKDKSDIMSELKNRNIPFQSRASKSSLESLLKNAIS